MDIVLGISSHFDGELSAVAAANASGVRISFFLPGGDLVGTAVAESQPPLAALAC